MVSSPTNVLKFCTMTSTPNKIVEAISDNIEGSRNPHVESPSDMPPPVAALHSSAFYRKILGFREKAKGYMKPVALVTLIILLIIFGPRALMRGVVWFTEASRGKPIVLVGAVLVLAEIFWCVFCIPFPSTVEMLSGFILGFGPGSAVNVVGVFVACVASFVIGRQYLRTALRDWINSKSAKWATTFRVIDQKGLPFLVLYRFLAVPFWLKNYGPAALLDCPVKDFAISVLLGSCPFGLLYAYIGDRSREITSEIADGTTSSGHPVHAIELFVIGVALAATVYVSFWAVKIFKQAEAENTALDNLEMGRLETVVGPVLAVPVKVQDIVVEKRTDEVSIVSVPHSVGSVKTSDGVSTDLLSGSPKNQKRGQHFKLVEEKDSP